MPHRIESESMTWLEYNEALQELRPESEVIVGTGAQATWRLRRADLMPRHFIVCSSPEGSTVRPFSSDAVVTVNGRQIPSAEFELHDGDLIGAGSGEFRYWAAERGESRTEIKAPVTAHLVDARQQSALTLNRVSTGIGSDESNALVIEGGAESFHAEVRREAGGHVLRIPESGAVRLNGRLVTIPVLLNDGDEIEIADQRFRYTQGALPEEMARAPQQRVTSATVADQEPVVATRVRASSTHDGSSAVLVRTPMRAVAFVSSVIAAVAIATLLFLHRGP